jgi:uridylate kinase
MIKATKVDGVYDKDPMKNEDAVFMKKITYKEVVQKNLKVMDSTAFAMAKDNDLVVKVVLFKK